MLMFIRKRLLPVGKKGQNTAEYAILIGIVIASFIAIQTYVKRGIQSRMRDEFDILAGQTSELTPPSRVNTGPTEQYEPYYFESKYTSEVMDGTYEHKGGVSKAPVTDYENIDKQSGYQQQTAPANP